MNSDRNESAEIILDSISPLGHRLTTVQFTIVRWVLSEFNTHRSHSRNSASSRAIPVSKQLDKVRSDPAWPIFWGSELRGMQSGPELEGQDLIDAQLLFQDVWEFTTSRLKQYLDSHGDVRLHKSLLNRLLEPFMWHTVIATATDAGWANFFAQRATQFSPLAQPEIAAAADLILEAYQNSEPRELDYYDWHTPYVTIGEVLGLELGEDSIEIMKKVSVARSARVSYLTHDGVRDIREDIALYDRLVKAEPPHWSPLEHVAQPAMWHEMMKVVPGNLTGWKQLRHLL